MHVSYSKKHILSFISCVSHEFTLRVCSASLLLLLDVVFTLAPFPTYYTRSSWFSFIFHHRSFHFGLSLCLSSPTISAPVTHHNKRTNTIAPEISGILVGQVLILNLPPHCSEIEMKTWSLHFNRFLIHFLEVSGRAFSSQARTLPNINVYI